MQQFSGFIDSTKPNHVCRLIKAIYGLKQSPRVWFNTLSATLIYQGFLASHYDPSLFILSTKDYTLVVLVYVDDTIITGSNQEHIRSFIQKLQSLFAIKDLGPLHYFLDIEVSHSQIDLHLSQSKYIRELLERANMHRSKASPTPMVSSTHYLNMRVILLTTPPCTDLWLAPYNTRP